MRLVPPRPALRAGCAAQRRAGLGMRRSSVQCSSVETGLSIMVRTQDDEQVGYHRCLALFVEYDHASFAYLFQSMFDHAHSTFHDQFACGEYRLSLLATQHGPCNFGRVGKVRNASVVDADTGDSNPLTQFIAQHLGYGFGIAQSWLRFVPMIVGVT